MITIIRHAGLQLEYALQYGMGGSVPTRYIMTPNEDKLMLTHISNLTADELYTLAVGYEKRAQIWEDLARQAESASDIDLMNDAINYMKEMDCKARGMRHRARMANR